MKRIEFAFDPVTLPGGQGGMPWKAVPVDGKSPRVEIFDRHGDRIGEYTMAGQMGRECSFYMGRMIEEVTRAMLVARPLCNETPAAPPKPAARGRTWRYRISRLGRLFRRGI